MTEYPSIETVFKRNPETHILELGKARFQEFEAINPWVVTEKVDGMNIRLIVTREEGQIKTEVRGRTDRAQLPSGVEAAVLDEVFGPLTPGQPRPNQEAFARAFEGMAYPVTIYGEAFGESIQKNPLRLSGKRFRAFDIMVGTRWLAFDNVMEIAKSVGFRTVPLLGLVNGVPVNEAGLDEITHGVSKIATEPVRPEGVVCRPIANIFNERGERILWKLTYREFDAIRKYEQKKVVEEQTKLVIAREPLVIASEMP